MHEVYGVDLGDPALDSRTWRWFKVRLFGLLNRPPVVTPAGPQWTTRLQSSLWPAPDDDGQVGYG